MDHRQRRLAQNGPADPVELGRRHAKLLRIAVERALLPKSRLHQLPETPDMRLRPALHGDAVLTFDQQSPRQPYQQQLKTGLDRQQPSRSDIAELVCYAAEQRFDVLVLGIHDVRLIEMG
jgi:hypothetical protein